MTSLVQPVVSSLLPVAAVVPLRPRTYAISGPNGPRLAERRPPRPEARQDATAMRRPPEPGRDGRSGSDNGTSGSGTRNPGLSPMWKMFVL